MADLGKVIFFGDGSTAGVVIGDGYGDDGTPDGSVIVGTFAGSEKVPAGGFGDQAGSSVVPGEAPAASSEGGAAVTPSRPVEPTHDVTASDTTTPVEPAETVDDEAAEDAELTELRRRNAELEADLAARDQAATSPPGQA